MSDLTKVSLQPSTPLVLKICLLPRGGIPLLGSSERLEILGVEKDEKITLQEDLDTRVEFAMLELSVLLY